jgi:hypothetical protein
VFFDNVDVASVLDDEVLSNEMCREAKAGASTGGRRRLQKHVNEVWAL